MLAEGLKRAENRRYPPSRAGARGGGVPVPTVAGLGPARARKLATLGAAKLNGVDALSRVPASARASASRWPRTSARRTPSPRLRSAPTSGAAAFEHVGRALAGAARA